MTKTSSIPTILLVAPQITDGFIKDDIRLLRHSVEVLPMELTNWRPQQTDRVTTIARLGRNMLRFVYYLLRFNVPVVVFWFVTTYETPLMVFIAKLFFRKVIIITGGYDAVYVPEIDWGAMKYARNRLGFRVVMRWADSILPFSNSSKEWIERHFYSRRIQTVYPAINTHFFTPAFETIQPRVVTSCYQYDSTSIVQKGLDVFVQVARKLPDINFVVIGDPITKEAKEFQQNAPPNVTFMRRIPTKSGYRDFLQNSSVYAQLSVHEGFGVSVAEAMACGCIPVVTNRYSLPEVVGECGWVVNYGKTCVDEAVVAIQQALLVDPHCREQARTRAITHFARTYRQRLLFNELRDLLPSLQTPVVRLELGCGSIGIAGAIGVDLRETPKTTAVCDVRSTCFKSECADEVYSYCVLEHLDNPYELMDEVVRLLKLDGKAFLRVPNIGTYSAHLDLTHRFLADLKLWQDIMHGYFEEVETLPVGTKYRTNRLLVAINTLLVKWFKFYELTQGWTFVCTRKRSKPILAYRGWWQETEGNS